MHSHPNVSFSAKFTSEIFSSPWSHVTVNGSFIRNAFWLLRTPETGTILRVSHATRKPHNPSIWIDDGSASVKLNASNNLRFDLEGYSVCRSDCSNPTRPDARRHSPHPHRPAPAPPPVLYPTLAYW